MKTNKITIEELLFNDEPITINRKLAKCLGLKEAVIFQQIHYWLKINEKKKHNIREGRAWTYNSIKNWHEEEFDFLSLRTVERTLKSLENEGLLICKTFNKMAGDKTKWYSINYEKLLEVAEKKLKLKKEKSIKMSKNGKLGVIAKKNKNKNTIQPNWHNGTHTTKLADTIQPNWQNDTTKLVEPIPEITTKTSTKTSTSSSSANVESNNLVDYFNENICELKKTTRVKFEKFIKNKSIEFVKALIDYQAEINTKSYAGFAKAIDNFKNLETVEELNAAIEKFRANKKQKSEFTNKTKKSNKNKVTTFEETKEQQLQSYNDLIELENDWIDDEDLNKDIPF